jgi:hypothetical protein
MDVMTDFTLTFTNTTHFLLIEEQQDNYRTNQI